MEVLFMVDMMVTVKCRAARYSLTLLLIILLILIPAFSVFAQVDYDLDPYQDPAGDVWRFNETWTNKGKVDYQDSIDIKLLDSNEVPGNVSLRMEFKNKQVIEQANETKYVFRIFTRQDNSTGYNITYINGTSFISDFNETFSENMTSNTTIIDINGEILIVKVSIDRYLSNISYYNIDGFTWKEQGNDTFIDYVSEIPGHPADTGTVVEQEEDDPKEEEGLLDMLCGIPYLLILVILVVVIIVIAALWRLRY
jgi:uncharacterized protein YlzI (FlbEa/FlbD family)